jgi:ribosome-associated translation inhibitor RaiA
MTLQFHFRGLKDGASLRRQLEASLDELNGPIALTSAEVALHHQREVTPPYQAVATLRVPGPDLHAAARDHSWPAAWQKVVTRLREQMEERQSRRTAPRKSQPPIHSPTSLRKR